MVKTFRNPYRADAQRKRSVEKREGSAAPFYWYLRDINSWAILHRGSCRRAVAFLEGGQGNHQGTWSGPFATRANAYAHIRGLHRTDVRECRICGRK